MYRKFFWLTQKIFWLTHFDISDWKFILSGKNLIYLVVIFSVGSWSDHKWPWVLSKRPQGTIDTYILFLFTQSIFLWSSNFIFSEKINTFQIDKVLVSMVPCGLFDKIHGHSWSDHEPTLIQTYKITRGKRKKKDSVLGRYCGLFRYLTTSY